MELLWQCYPQQCLQNVNQRSFCEAWDEILKTWSFLYWTGIAKCNYWKWTSHKFHNVLYGHASTNRSGSKITIKLKSCLRAVGMRMLLSTATEMVRVVGLQSLWLMRQKKLFIPHSTFIISLDSCLPCIFADGRANWDILEAQRKHGSGWGLISTFRKTRKRGPLLALYVSISVLNVIQEASGGPQQWSGVWELGRCPVDVQGKTCQELGAILQSGDDKQMKKHLSDRVWLTIPESQIVGCPELSQGYVCCKKIRKRLHHFKD